MSGTALALHRPSRIKRPSFGGRLTPLANKPITAWRDFELKKVHNANNHQHIAPYKVLKAKSPSRTVETLRVFASGTRTNQIHRMVCASHSDPFASRRTAGGFVSMMQADAQSVERTDRLSSWFAYLRFCPMRSSEPTNFLTASSQRNQQNIIDIIDARARLRRAPAPLMRSLVIACFHASKFSAS
ncbi:hypothetical protein O181_007492 [Austropuccinia psidii MF-1]|uniref:Uncharacterized protein n=1 Tax=Austropuccinia psidii MF-1 TaxID=1389203 RepID=A0A9Q3BMV3_9BASI|nr:hypothetical protein [Austropuccinia psidii MF-1]